LRAPYDVEPGLEVTVMNRLTRKLRLERKIAFADGHEEQPMTTKGTAKTVVASGRAMFSGFKMASNGAMVVERNKLHDSDGYKRQVQALTVLREHRKEKVK
jgi:hypothetical protein